MRNVVPAVITMIAYGLAVLFIGGLTYFVAPPGANALTALIISILAAVFMTTCAILSLMIESRRTLGMIGIHLGLILPLVIAVGPFMRLRASLDHAHAFNAAVAEAGGLIVSKETIADKSKPSPIAYQTVGLGSIGALSVFAFITLIVQRPRVPKPHAASTPAPVQPMPHEGPTDPRPSMPPPPPPMS